MHHLAVPESDEAYLTAQLETCRDRHALTNAIDQRFHVRCRRPVAGLDEVGVFVRRAGVRVVGVGEGRGGAPAPVRPKPTATRTPTGDSWPGIGFTNPEPAFCPP